ncbi:hypothetical protein [Lactobacillus helveticus]|uniref:hypothetical protein n=1 Tax=Lactobacillus helveticus TaxID=1587 RepID=UPI001561FB97|nr:hypothetical protein [Lactobacillus helveticus]NRO50612.1 hypothetical protein [Lactobacillus helveticus]NRO68069.1 hypothetical protein [Lactobacillus helveticus]NRO69944.1 hypothetical protein [Lactobacillus helveticus]
MTKEAAQIAKKWIDESDAILVTASNGLSISEGLNLFADDAKLKEVLDNLVDKYHLSNLLTAFSYQYPDELDYWRVIARTVEYYSNNYQPSVYMQDLKKIMTGKSHGATTQGPTKPQPKPELTPEQKAEQAKVMQQFYPDYMVDSGIRPSSFPMYLTIDQKHPSYLHTVQYGQSMMYSIGDAAIVHCFTQDG